MNDMIAPKTRTLAGSLLSLCILLMIPSPNPAQGAPFAYITNFEGRSISVIDVATNTVVVTIDEVAPC